MIKIKIIISYKNINGYIININLTHINNNNNTFIGKNSNKK